MHVAAADELDVGARLAQQRRGFGILAAPDHRNAAAAEDAEIAVLAGVARKRGGDGGEGLRPECLSGEPGRDHDPTRMNVRAIHGLGAETVAGGFEPRDHPGIDFGDGGAVKPHAVIDESFERERLAPREAARRNEGVESEIAARIGMCVAPHGERSFMPCGILCRQNDIGSPNTRVTTPWAAR